MPAGITPEITSDTHGPQQSPAWVWLLLAGAAFLGGQIVGGIVAIVLTLGAGEELTELHPPSVLMGTAVGAMITIPLALLFARRLHWGSLTPVLGPRRIGWLLGGIGLGVAVVIVNAGLSALALQLDPGLEAKFDEYSDQWTELFEGASWRVGLFLVAVVVLAPLSEELVFRVLLLGGLRRLMPFWPAAMISGALFSAVHLQPAWAISLGLFAAGVGLAWIYRRAGYWAAVATHATVNLFAAGSLLLT